MRAKRERSKPQVPRADAKQLGTPAGISRPKLVASAQQEAPKGNFAMAATLSSWAQGCPMTKQGRETPC